MMPCIKNKCLLYAVCRNKTVINCEDLMVCIDSIAKSLDPDMNCIKRDNMWLDINKELPNVIRIFPDIRRLLFHKSVHAYYMSAHPAFMMREMNEEGKKFAIGDRLVTDEGKLT